ncbi:MAG: lytic transglycosylase domain-containing protein [Gammaproteobacteria bacterium]|nr:lytic transglycosylase domain-containing protein [Gammaproteobacteria bacterium]
MHTFHHRIRLAICALAALGLGTHVRADELARGRAEFRAAMLRVAGSAADHRDPASLRRYPLYGYLVAARLQRDLASHADEALDERIEAFLQAHPGEPVGRALERAWLASLANRGLWGPFLARSDGTNDPALQCDRLAGRIATGDSVDLPAAAIARWLQPRAAPPECAKVFDWLRRLGLLSADLRELRTRAALAAGEPALAVQFAAQLPPERAAPLLLWARLLADPQAGFETLLGKGAVDLPDEAVDAGFLRLSRRDGAAAAALLPRLLARVGTTADLAARLRLDVALGEAYDHDPGTLAAFAEVPPEEIDPAAAEWRIRAALWAGDYAGALPWILHLPPALGAEPRWRYWYARAIDATTGFAAARPLYAQIAGLRDFYGYLAADRLHRPYSLQYRRSPVDRRLQRRLAARPGLVRAHELVRCAMQAQASAEWTAALADADPGTFVQAAEIASRWGWYRQAILTLKRANAWDDVRLRYPRPYRAAVLAASRRAHVPADWLFAIMRQESLFDAEAISPADARGLMQLRLETARRVARRSHLARPTAEALLDPATALRLGAAYLRELLDRYAGALGPTLAAYNAGPGALARWRPPHSMDADVWIENIPYLETREYLQHIAEHIVAYAWVRGATPPRLSRLLPPVEPETASQSAMGDERR